MWCIIQFYSVFFVLVNGVLCYTILFLSAFMCSTVIIQGRKPQGSVPIRLSTYSLHTSSTVPIQPVTSQAPLLLHPPFSLGASKYNMNSIRFHNLIRQRFTRQRNFIIYFQIICRCSLHHNISICSLRQNFNQIFFF